MCEHSLIHLILLLLILICECWLGRTSRIKANSILELTAVVVVFVLHKLINKGNSNGTGQPPGL